MSDNFWESLKGTIINSVLIKIEDCNSKGISFTTSLSPDLDSYISFSVEIIKSSETKYTLRISDDNETNGMMAVNTGLFYSDLGIIAQNFIHKICETYGIIINIQENKYFCLEKYIDLNISQNDINQIEFEIQEFICGIICIFNSIHLKA